MGGGGGGNVIESSLRRKLSREAARKRRRLESDTFADLCRLLPLPPSVTRTLDKPSVIRLTLSYMRTHLWSDVVPMLQIKALFLFSERETRQTEARATGGGLGRRRRTPARS
uniref:BHLH domain-containing protein n=1 Tax=Takifugu rubripes TaxID=31033 RepID=A0A674MFC9_TAKRU